MPMEKLSLYRRRTLAIALLAVGLVSLGGIAVAQDRAETQPAEPQTASPEVILLKYHADWCGSCRAMGPIMEDLQNKMDGRPVLFLTLDLTNRSTRQQAEYLIDALDLTDVWHDHGGGKSTGFMVAVDAETGRVIGKFNKTHSMKQIAAALERAIPAKAS